MENDQLIYIVSIAIVAIVISIYYFKNIPGKIPIVVIAYNNLFFVRNFIDQLKKYENPIILFDNNSTYEPLLQYYKEIKEELGSKIDIRLMDENYGSGVYMTFKHTLPQVFILSDPDLELNSRMPENFSEIFLELSNKYQAYKIAAALDISEPDKLLPCKNYCGNRTIYEWESQYWKIRVPDDKYELYKAGHPMDTTFCLINNNYPKENKIRIAGDFTAKHLPWYNNYIKENVSEKELRFWKKNNKSSSILNGCITD
jgi:hypothetical protein